MDKIKGGIFIMPFHPPEKPLAQSHDEDMELALAAEEFGFDEFWVGEHHTMGWEPIVSPEMFIAAVFRQTERMRLGPSPILLNLHHPVQVAHRLAFWTIFHTVASIWHSGTGDRHLIFRCTAWIGPRCRRGWLKASE